MHKTYKPIIIIGKSGAGKDTTVKVLTEKYGFKRVIEYTTRQKRPNETNGVEYNFVTDEEYDKMLKDNEFISTSTFDRVQDGNVCKVRYGIRKDDLVDNTILSTNPSSMRQIKSQMDDVIVVYIFVPGYIRAKRLRSRGDDKSEIERRLMSDNRDFDEETENNVDILVLNGIFPSLNREEKSPENLAEEILKKVRKLER